MSKLSDFIDAAAPQATAIIGTETLTLSTGATLAGIRNATKRSRDFQDIGIDIDGAFDFVVSASDFHAAFPAGAKAMMGTTATLAGNTYRVRGVEDGAFFVTVSLAQPSKST